MVQAATLGLPSAMAEVGAALGLEKQKLTEGKELIRFFCKPAPDGHRRLPSEAPEKWERFRQYNVRDVDVEADIKGRLARFPRPQAEHNGFVDLLEDYEKNFLENPDSSIDPKLFQPTHNKFTHTEADYPAYERQISHYNAAGSMCRMGCLAGFLRTLALAGEIDEKYATEEGAFHGAELYQSCTCNCLRDNYMVTGSTTLQPEGMIKLLLNGAIDYIMEEKENVCP